MKNTTALYCILFLIANLSACSSLELFGAAQEPAMPTLTLSILTAKTSAALPMKTDPPHDFGTEELEPQKCNRASPGNPLDLSIPDGTILRPGEFFSKTWRLFNDGTCPWSPDYSLVWFSGVSTGLVEVQQLSKEVLPGEGIDITMDMAAPQKTGIYQSNWKLRSADGELFGIGPDGSAPFWVRIQVFDIRTQLASPTQTVTPQPQVYNSGSKLLKLAEWVDLDRTVSTDEREADLSLSIGTGNKLQLEPKNGSKITLFGMKLPTQAECRSASLSAEPFSLDRIADGIYVCYRSQIGLTGYARIIKMDKGEKSINLEFVTWAAPQRLDSSAHVSA
jgi:hypothetical protein